MINFLLANLAFGGSLFSMFHVPFIWSSHHKGDYVYWKTPKAPKDKAFPTNFMEVGCVASLINPLIDTVTALLQPSLSCTIVTIGARSGPSVSVR